jgi:glutamate dehydrogenase/leucine dehydrogenase
VVAGDFDTGRDLGEFPTEKLEGKKLAVIGYGNIGREVARIASAFGMRVAMHARPRHCEWIESEGFEFAATPIDAARGADVISVHTGLGPLNAVTGKYANAGVLDAAVFAALKPGAVVINYDRGECIDAKALDAALASGQVRYAAIDADLFKDAKTGALSGPMVPYLELAKRYPGRLELLPHAAADTEHVSRVAGAKQAVDQIMAAIQFHEVTNLKGSLPGGYRDMGAYTVPCVGKATSRAIATAAADAAELAGLRDAAEKLAAIWGAISSTTDPARRAELISRHGASLIMTSNRYATLMHKHGLEGPMA